MYSGSSGCTLLQQGHRRVGVKMRKLKLLFWLSAILSATALVYANLDGPPSGYTRAPGEATCSVTGCHDTPTARTGKAHVLPTYVGHGDTISLQLLLFYSPANGSVENFGFQLTTLDSMDQPFGQILVSDSIRTKLNTGPTGRGYLSQTAAGVPGPICVWCT